MMKRSFAKICFALLAFGVMPASAQYLRTSYFMEGTHYRQQLNPALTPGRGYLNLPIVGSFNATVSSNAFGYSNVMDMLENDNAADYFMSNSFMDDLKTRNTLNLNLSTDILSAGWYKGKNFWSFNIGMKVDFGAALPKNIFEFMRHMNGEFDNLDKYNGNHFSIGQEEFHVSTYAEVGLGFARQINKKWTVGGRAKVLLGIGNIDLNVNKMDIGMNVNVSGNPNLSLMSVDWGKVASIDPNNPTRSQEAFEYAKSLGLVDYDLQTGKLTSNINGSALIEAEATMDASFKGLDIEWKKDKNGVNVMDDFEFNKFGISGWGLGLDLGVAYQPVKNLKLSASLLDIGFIKWAGKHTQKTMAHVENPLQYKFVEGQDVQTLLDFASTVSSGEILNYDMFHMEEVKAEDRTTSIAATLAVGAEYSMLNDWLVLGALSTTRFTQPKALTELTLSANIRPKNWFNLAVSYSMIQSAGKSVGLAAKIGPVFVGTDYMFFGKDTKAANAYLGISLPLGAKKKD